MGNFNPRDAYIVSGCRTAIGSLNGALSCYSAPQLGSMAIAEAVQRAHINPEDCEYVIMGQVVQAGSGQNPARQATIKSGLPVTVPAVTINRVCGSGLLSVMMAATDITSDRRNVIIAGGMESMSNSPYALPDMRRGARLGSRKVDDLVVSDGLTCPFNCFHMGNIGDWTARNSSLTREELDSYAAQSYAKAVAAQENGNFATEIFPVEVPQKKESIVFQKDEDVKPTSIEALAGMRPAFARDGLCTAGNSPGINDGAAAVVVVSGRYLNENPGIKPIARIVDYSEVAGLPMRLFYMPIEAVNDLCAKMQVDINHFHLIEANEAFSSQSLVCGRGLGWDWKRVNVNGGGVALGHPIGASGTRILVTLIYALKDRGMKTGCATLCLGGGGAVSMAIEIVC